MKKITLTIITLLIIQLINAQQTISTYSTGYNSIQGIAINSNNEVFVSEHDTGKVYSIDASTGNKTEYASTGGFYADNIIFNDNNDLFIAEPYMTKIYIKNATADATVYLDINFTPHSFAIDSNGNLYVSAGPKIVKINSDLSTTDYATGFMTVEGIAFDSNDNLYAADRNDRKLYKIASNGTKTVVASNIQNIRGVAIDPNDKVYFTNSIGYSALNGKILKYDPTTNAVTDFVTTNLDNPRYLAIDDLGNMYVTNLGSETVVKINDTSLLSSSASIIDNHLELFNVYPNPIKDNLIIEGDVMIKKISIYNELGEMLLSNNKMNILETSTLIRGIYYLKITDVKGNIETKKIIKK